MERYGSRQDIDSLADLSDTLARGGRTADELASSLGRKLESASDLIRDKLPREGRIGDAARAVSDGLETSGAYLQEQGVTGIIEDLETNIRRYPIQALLIGAGIGFLLSRLSER